MIENWVSIRRGRGLSEKCDVWGSRIITSEGRSLLQAIQSGNLDFMSTGQLTYWLTDLNKLSDFLDSFTRDVSQIHAQIETNYSDVIVTVSTDITWSQNMLRDMALVCLRSDSTQRSTTTSDQGRDRLSFDKI